MVLYILSMYVFLDLCASVPCKGNIFGVYMVPYNPFFYFRLRLGYRKPAWLKSTSKVAKETWDFLLTNKL
jgi:hypothetical protein